MSTINTWPDWESVRQMDEGAYGKVYEIQKTDIYVGVSRAALKVISIPQSQSDLRNALSEGMSMETIREEVMAFSQEIKLLSSLQGHSNIVSYQDHKIVEHPDGLGWDLLIRMELLTPLDRYSMCNRMSESDIIRLGCDICRALELCEQKKIIHRDIKPANIMVNDNGDFKLGDFGVARTVEKTKGMSKKGTESYMAPEVYCGKRYNATVDIYSLGMVLYYYLNEGRGPFLPLPPNVVRVSDKETALLRRIDGEALPKPKNCSNQLWRVLQKAIAFRPEDRFSTAAYFRSELEKVATLPYDLHVPPMPQPEPTPPRPDPNDGGTEGGGYNPQPGGGGGKKERRKLKIAVGCAALIVVILAIGLIIWKPWQQTSPQSPVTETPDTQETTVQVDPEPSSTESDQVGELELNETTLNLVVGDTIKLKVLEDGVATKRSVKWESKSDLVAKVDAAGTVTAKRFGAVTITATVEGQVLKCKISVKSEEKDETPEEKDPVEKPENVVDVEPDYLLPDSSKRRLTEKEIQHLSHEELCFARNEIYARHGWIFSVPELKAYFESKSWYHGTVLPAEFDASVLSAIELDNLELISNYEDRMYGGSYY